MTKTLAKIEAKKKLFKKKSNLAYKKKKKKLRRSLFLLKIYKYGRQRKLITCAAVISSNLCL